MDKDKQLIVRVPKDLHTQAKVEAAKAGKSLTQIVEELLRHWLAKQQAKT